MIKSYDNQERNYTVNVLKFIAIIFVFCIHYKPPGRLGEIIVHISRMAVPAFFMISGYYSYGVTIERLWMRSKRIFQQMIIANIIYFFWDICAELISGNSLEIWLKANCNIKRLLVFVLTNESPFRGHLWFLGALLYSYLFLIFVLKCCEIKGSIGKFLQKNYLRCFIIISFFLLLINLLLGEVMIQYGQHIRISYTPYIRNWMFTGIPFFCIAYYIHAHEEWIRQHLNHKLWGFFVIVVVLNILELLYMQSSELYVTTIFVDIFSFLLVLKYRVKNKFLIIIGNLADSYGLWVYIIQIMIIKNIRWLLKMLEVDDVMAIKVLGFFVAIILTFLLSVIPIKISAAIKKEKVNG